jgi:ferritin-like metal-binding protein YciE
MPALRSPEDMLTTELKEIYSAERQLTRVLPRLSKKVSSTKLREMLEQRVEQGEDLIEQIDEALGEMDVSKGRAKNIAAEGLIEDVNHHMEEVEDEKLLDPLLLASVQKIEHYCIAAWGAARSMGELLGQESVVKAMQHALSEGKKFDDEMTKLAESEINPRMMEGGSSEDEDSEEMEEESQGSGAKKRSSSKRSKAH